MTAAEDVESVGERELELRRGAAPHHGADLGDVVLEREVAVAGLRAREVRDFAGDPHRWEAAFEQVLDARRELGDGERLRGGGDGGSGHGDRSRTASGEGAVGTQCHRQDTKRGSRRRFTRRDDGRRAGSAANGSSCTGGGGAGSIADDDFASLAGAGRGPGFGFGGQAVEQPLGAEAAGFESGAVEIRRDHHRRTDDGAGPREHPRHGEVVPTLRCARAIVAEAHRHDRNLQPRGKIDRSLGELAARAAGTVGRDRQMLRAAAFFELPERPRAAAIGRAADAIEAEVVGDAGQDVGVAVLAQEHREVAVAAERERQQDVFVPEDVDPRPLDAEDGVDGAIVERGPRVERAASRLGCPWRRAGRRAS